MTDKYTKEVLETQYHTHKEYVQKRITLSKELKINFRLPCIPEDISENFIKFAIHKSGNKTCSWNRGKGGDLVAQQDGHNIKIECKCFTSSGPLSFTPSSTWDTIYFMDATNSILKPFGCIHEIYSIHMGAYICHGCNQMASKCFCNLQDKCK